MADNAHPQSCINDSYIPGTRYVSALTCESCMHISKYFWRNDVLQSRGVTDGWRTKGIFRVFLKRCFARIPLQYLLLWSFGHMEVFLTGGAMLPFPPRGLCGSCPLVGSPRIGKHGYITSLGDAALPLTQVAHTWWISGRPEGWRCNISFERLRPQRLLSDTMLGPDRLLW